MWLVSLKEEEISTQMHTEGRPCEDTGRRGPSAHPGEKPQEEPALPTPGPQIQASSTGRNKCLLFEPPQSGVLCYGSPRKIIQLISPLVVNRDFLEDRTSVSFFPRSVLLRFPQGWFQFCIKNIRHVTCQHTYLIASSTPLQRTILQASVWAGQRESRLKKKWGDLQELREAAPCCIQPRWDVLEIV